jgi:thiamine monophosphate kinase
MFASATHAAVLEKLEELRRLCPEMRLGQMLAVVGNLGEDSTGLSLWNIEDRDFAAALERFVVGMQRRANGLPVE